MSVAILTPTINGGYFFEDAVMEKLFLVWVTIKYPAGVKYTYESKVIAESRREAIRKLIDFEMITKTMTCKSGVVQS